LTTPVIALDHLGVVPNRGGYLLVPGVARLKLGLPVARLVSGVAMKLVSRLLFIFF
jgi:hypothetical protein